jgi:hypothetical protein
MPTLHPVAPRRHLRRRTTAKRASYHCRQIWLGVGGGAVEPTRPPRLPLVLHRLRDLRHATSSAATVQATTPLGKQEVVKALDLLGRSPAL